MNWHEALAYCLWWHEGYELYALASIHIRSICWDTCFIVELFTSPRGRIARNSSKRNIPTAYMKEVCINSVHCRWLSKIIIIQAMYAIAVATLSAPLIQHHPEFKKMGSSMGTEELLLNDKPKFLTVFSKLASNSVADNLLTSVLATVISSLLITWGSLVHSSEPLYLCKQQLLWEADLCMIADLQDSANC